MPISQVGLLLENRLKMCWLFQINYVKKCARTLGMTLINETGESEGEENNTDVPIGILDPEFSQINKRKLEGKIHAILGLRFMIRRIKKY